MNRLIKDFNSWRLFEAAESSTDPTELFKAGDRAGLMALAAQTDSAAVKAKPGYAAVIKWWTDGHGDLSFWKSAVKSGSAAQTDKALSLKSAFYWVGSGSNTTDSANYVKFIKAIDATIANKAKVEAWIKSRPTAQQGAYSAAWIDNLAKLKADLEKSKAEGLVISAAGMITQFPSQLKDNALDSKSFSDLMAGTPPDSALRPLAIFKPTMTIDQLLADKTKNGTTYWKASIQLTEADKLAILDAFAAKAKVWADKQNKKKPGSETVESAIAKANDLYISPSRVQIQVQAAGTPAEPKTVTAFFSYPENPKGDEQSEAFKKGLQMFPDDGTTIGQQALSELKTAVKDAVAKVKAAGGEVTGVTTYAYSSTSKVPTKYGSADNTWKPENNVQLANDRLAAINAALAQAISEAGIEIAPTVDAANNKAMPNQGPDWGDAQRRDVTNYGKPGARTEKYQQEYGKWRFASGFFTLTYKVSSTAPAQVQASATPSGTWKSIINWNDETITVDIPKISFGSSYRNQPKPAITKPGTACPIF